MYNRTEIASLLKNQPIGEKVTVMGWVRAFRNNQFIFKIIVAYISITINSLVSTENDIYDQYP